MLNLIKLLRIQSRGLAPQQSMIGSVLRQLELTRKLIEPAPRIVVDELLSLSRLAKALRILVDERLGLSRLAKALDFIG